MNRDEMVRYLQQCWQRTPLLVLLHRMHRNVSAGALPPARLQEELLSLLSQFERFCQTPVQFVAEGMVQASRGAGNCASLRSSPGVLQIERQVLQDPATLLAEVTHEVCYLLAGGPSNVPRLGDGALNAMELLEMMVTGSPAEVFQILQN